MLDTQQNSYNPSHETELLHCKSVYDPLQHMNMGTYQIHDNPYLPKTNIFWKSCQKANLSSVTDWLLNTSHVYDPKLSAYLVSPTHRLIIVHVLGSLTCEPSFLLVHVVHSESVEETLHAGIPDQP